MGWVKKKHLVSIPNEKGKTNIAKHAARWKGMKEQLASKRKPLQIREGKLRQEKTRLEGLERDRTNALTAEVASKANTNRA